MSRRQTTTRSLSGLSCVLTCLGLIIVWGTVPVIGRSEEQAIGR
jgi:hypothetical protein